MENFRGRLLADSHCKMECCLEDEIKKEVINILLVGCHGGVS